MKGTLHADRTPPAGKASPMLKRLIALTGVTLLAAAVAAGPALAAPAHIQVKAVWGAPVAPDTMAIHAVTAPDGSKQPDFTCPSGYIQVANDSGEGYTITGEGVGNDMETTDATNYCLSLPKDNTFGEIRTVADNCVTGTQAVLEPCKGDSSQEWYAYGVGDGVYTESNDADMIAGNAADLSAENFEDGSFLDGVTSANYLGYWARCDWC
jgi:hypothetical protein